MLHRVLQIELNRAHVDTKSGSNFLMGQLLEMSGDEYLAPARGQFSQGSIERLEFKARASNRGGIGTVILDICNRRDLCRIQKMGINLAAILCYIDGRPEKIIGRTADCHGFRDAFDTQECLVKGFPCEIRRAQTPGQAICKPLVVT